MTSATLPVVESVGVFPLAVVWTPARDVMIVTVDAVGVNPINVTVTPGVLVVDVGAEVTSRSRWLSQTAISGGSSALQSSNAGARSVDSHALVKDRPRAGQSRVGSQFERKHIL